MLKTWLSGLSIGLLLSGCASVPQKTSYDLYMPPNVLSPEEGDMLTWTQDDMDARFRAMETHYPGHFIPAGAGVPLPKGPALAVDADELADYMAEMSTAGLLILKDGKIVLEEYARGHSEDQRYTSFSMAKSFMAVLLGAAIKDGYIDSVNDTLVKYLPELKGSAYDGVTIEQALRMKSGVAWSEDYADRKADVAVMLSGPPPEGEDSTISYMKRLKGAHTPGAVWNYSTGESHLLGVLVKRVTGRNLSQYLSEKIWVPAGMEDDGFWMVDWSQNDLGGCCISARLRDYGRFGQFIMNHADDVVSENYRRDMLASDYEIPGYPGVGYAYQWWTYPNGRYGAQGLNGQNIIMIPEDNIVIVVSSALKTSGDPKVTAKRFAYIETLIKAANNVD